MYTAIKTISKSTIFKRHYVDGDPEMISMGANTSFLNTNPQFTWKKNFSTTKE